MTDYLRGGLAVLALSIGFGLSSGAMAQVVPGEEHCVVNVASGDVLNMREEPSSRARIVAQKRYGQCGILVQAECQGSWCPVEDGHSLGWVNRRFISMVSPAMYCVSGVAAGDTLNLRAWPSPQSRVVAKLKRRQCDISFLPYSRDGWQKIRVRGWEGWVNRRYLSGQ